MTNLLPLINPYDDCSKFDNFSVLSGIANRAPLILGFNKVPNPPIPIDPRISRTDPEPNNDNKSLIPNSVPII